jgi:hypothetical protein
LLYADPKGTAEQIVVLFARENNQKIVVTKISENGNTT